MFLIFQNPWSGLMIAVVGMGVVMHPAMAVIHEVGGNNE